MVAPNIHVSGERALEIAGAELLKEIISHKATEARFHALVEENMKLNKELERIKNEKKEDLPDISPEP